MKNEKGQVLVFALLIVPALTALAAFAVDFGLLVDRKIKLQITADRAVYAGSARLAHIMNRIAEENWAIHKSFSKVYNNFNPNSQGSIDECKQRVKEMENAQDTARLENIEDMLKNAYAEANGVARSVASANFGDAIYETLYGKEDEGLFELADTGGEKEGGEGSSLYDEDEDKIRTDVVCGNIKGLVFAPDDKESLTNPKLLQYTYKHKDGDDYNYNYVGLIIKLKSVFRAPLFKDIFPDIELSAVSAGQPYGGSIKRFALLASDKNIKTIEDARARAISLAQDEGKPYFYRPALVPALLALPADVVDEDENEEAYLQ